KMKKIISVFGCCKKRTSPTMTDPPVAVTESKDDVVTLEKEKKTEGGKEIEYNKLENITERKDGSTNNNSVVIVMVPSPTIVEDEGADKWLIEKDSTWIRAEEKD